MPLQRSDGALDQALAALADPARRGVIDLLRRQPHRVGDLAGALALSAPRMSQHLRVLRRCGLVEEAPLEEDARVRVYRLRREPFQALRHWLDDVEGFWTAELEAFRSYVERTRPSDRASHGASAERRGEVGRSATGRVGLAGRPKAAKDAKAARAERSAPKPRRAPKPSSRASRSRRR